MLCLSLLTFSNITKFLYSFFTISLKYFASCLAKTANLFNESTMFGLNSFFMYGISKFLILFLVYILSLLVLSNFGSSLFSSQYASISSLEHSIKGLINFPLIGSIPFNPSKLAPLIKFINTVSALSFSVCAIAILSADTLFAT